MKTDKKSSTRWAKVKVNKEMVLTQGDFFFIGGPCVIEDGKMVFSIASELKRVCASLRVPFIFKASYDKANRSSIKSFRGVGAKKGLEILRNVKKELGVPVLTDIHTVEEARAAGRIVDVLQIPAFLCRQTDLVVAAAKTGKAVNIKKGQFLSPYEMENIVKKAEKTGNKNIFVTERGFSFGYSNLVVDMKSIACMKKNGYPVIIDATHAAQKPGGAGETSGGEREYVGTIARAAVAAGADGVFMEVHHDIKNAKSDRETQYPLEHIGQMIATLRKIHMAVNE